MKLAWRWLSPYRIHCVNKNGSYVLEELDGAEMKGTVNGNRLKKYYTFEDFSEATQESVEMTDQEVSESEQEEDPSADESGDVEVAETSDRGAASIGSAGSASIPAGWDFAVVV